MSFLINKKESINRSLSFFLLMYLFLLILPYLFGRVEAINNFFSTGWSQMIYRFLTMMVGVIYLSLLALINKIKPNIYLVIGGSVLLFLLLLSSIISPSDIYFPDGPFLIHIKWTWYLYDFIRLAISIILFILSFNVIPMVMKSHKDLNYPLYLLIGITLFSILMSFILEGNLLIEVLKGINTHEADIRSIYQSKNVYGLFLFLSSLASTYLIFTNMDDNKYLLFFIPLFIFTIMAAITGCRTALIASFALIIYLLIRVIMLLRVSSKKSFYISIGVIGELLFIFILYMCVPIFHVSPINHLYNIVIYGFNNIVESFNGRMSIWSSVGEFMNGHYLWIGANFSNSQYLLGAYNGHFKDFHSGYVKWFATFGILGTIIYAALFIYIFYLTYKTIRKDAKSGLLVLIYLLCTMLYAISESNTIFISTSLYTWITNLLVVVYLNYILKDTNTEKA